MFKISEVKRDIAGELGIDRAELFGEVKSLDDFIATTEGLVELTPKVRLREYGKTPDNLYFVLRIVYEANAKNLSSDSNQNSSEQRRIKFTEQVGLLPYLLFLHTDLSEIRDKLFKSARQKAFELYGQYQRDAILTTLALTTN